MGFLRVERRFSVVFRRLSGSVGLGDPRGSLRPRLAAHLPARLVLLVHPHWRPMSYRWTRTPLRMGTGRRRRPDSNRWLWCFAGTRIGPLCHGATAPPLGVEPNSQDSQSCILSGGPRGQDAPAESRTQSDGLALRRAANNTTGAYARGRQRSGGHCAGEGESRRGRRPATLRDAAVIDPCKAGPRDEDVGASSPLEPCESHARASARHLSSGFSHWSSGFSHWTASDGPRSGTKSIVLTIFVRRCAPVSGSCVLA